MTKIPNRKWTIYFQFQIEAFLSTSCISMRSIGFLLTLGWPIDDPHLEWKWNISEYYVTLLVFITLSSYRSVYHDVMSVILYTNLCGTYPSSVFKQIYLKFKHYMEYALTIKPYSSTNISKSNMTGHKMKLDPNSTQDKNLNFLHRHIILTNTFFYSRRIEV